jgi:Na+/proline symporter/signal transduction histidine kinase
MAVQGWTVVLVGLAYVGLLFGVATWGDAKSSVAGHRRRPKPLIYALSLAVFCTSWTYFGSVGIASRTGFDFVPVYLGPILIFMLGSGLISRVVVLAKRQNIASLADFIAARYGKHEGLGALVAIIATLGIIPYISIQLKALSFSLQAMMAGGVTEVSAQQTQMGGNLALLATVALSIFAMLFGTRHIDTTEHQEGLTLAIAVESVVKIAAFLSVGIFVTFWLADGPWDVLRIAREHEAIGQVFTSPPNGARWITVTLLSACAMLLLPRQFHVAVVENTHGSDVRRAAWLFPLYLVAINLFVAPIAIVGLHLLPGTDADTYVLALPVAAQSQTVALVAFIGGLSAATAMVIMETIALSIMLSNNVIVPLVLMRQGEHNMFQHSASGDKSPALIIIRRITICVILFLAYIYFWSAGNSAALAQTGLISFAAVVQFAPAFFGGMVWRRATARGAFAGISAGFAVWAYTLLLPSFVDSGWLPKQLLLEGAFGISALRPRQLMGLAFDPLTHGVIWSLTCNILAFISFSLLRAPTRIEALQADIFSTEQGQVAANPGFKLWRSSITLGQLEETVSRYLGRERARAAFAEFAQSRDVEDNPAMEADVTFINHAEHLVASAVGPASSRLVMALLLERHVKGSRQALQLLDDASTAIQSSRNLLQSAIDNVPQGIAVFNARNELVIWNPPFPEVMQVPAHLCRMSTPASQILSPDLVAGLRENSDVQRQRFMDPLRVIDIQSAKLPDGSMVVTFTDVTATVSAADALKRANATLEQRVEERMAELTKLNDELAKAKAAAENASLSKTRFIAAASHDILQPLNAARLFTSSLVEMTAKTDQAKLVNSVDQSLEAVEDILSTILDISRFDAGAIKPVLTTFRVQDVLGPLAEEFAPLAKQQGLDLTLVTSTLIVRSDIRLLRRILQNLISNAIKYTPKGRVLLGCRRKGAQVEICVCDTGLGIPEAEQRIVFVEFERLGQDNGATPGLGLGLSIVERMSRALRHPLNVRSRVKSGSIFSICVPTGHSDAIVLPSTATQRSPIYNPLHGLSVLAIDNEPAIVDGLKSLLSGWGVHVATATTAEKALSEPHTYDAILADYHINRQDGIALVRALRENNQRPVPAVLITADRSPHIKNRAENEGILHLKKPVKPAALRAALSQLAARKAAE